MIKSEEKNTGSTQMDTDKTPKAGKNQPLPEGWEWKKLGDVCEIVNGGTPKSSIKEYWNGDIDWVTPKDMGKLKNRYISETPRKITEYGLQKSSAKLLPPNSVILSTRAPIGHLAINLVDISTNQGCRGIVPNNSLFTEFLFYFLYNSIDQLNNLGNGATFKELSSTSLASVFIPLPPLAEQKRIVAILDEAFAAIDKSKANAEKNLANASELFESYLNGIFANPGEDWEEKRLNHISENLDSKRKPVTKRDRKIGEYPYYGASGIVDYVDDYIFDEGLLLISEDGANLLARTYPIAFSICGKTWVNNHAHVLKFSNPFTQKFVQEYLNHTRIDEYVSGMAQPKLNQRMLNQIPIFLPDEKVQEVIVEKIDKLSTETKQLESIYQQKIATLEELKKSILKKAFEGEL